MHSNMVEVLGKVTPTMMKQAQLDYNIGKVVHSV